MRTILVVDDHLEVRENISEILELSNYRVIQAADGKAAVEMALKHVPDLVLCDIMMPGMDGYAVLRILRRDARTGDIPFLFLTAKVDSADFRKGMNLGADDYITKPFDSVELLDAIAMRLKKGERISKLMQGDCQSFLNEKKAWQALEALAHNRERRHFETKEIIYREGQKARYLYRVDEGKVKIFRTNKLGKEFVTHINDAGDFFGINALIGDDVYREGASALEPSTIKLIPRADFMDVLLCNQHVAALVIRKLANAVDQTEDHLIHLAYDSVRKRIADALLMLCKDKQGDEVEINILREDLSNMAGTAKESVSRTLSDFKAEHIIDIQEGLITILSRDKLAGIAN